MFVGLWSQTVADRWLFTQSMSTSLSPSLASRSTAQERRQTSLEVEHVFAADEEAATLSTAHAAGEEITRMFPKFPVSFIFLPLTIFHVKWHTLAAAAAAVGGSNVLSRTTAERHSNHSLALTYPLTHALHHDAVFHYEILSLLLPDTRQTDSRTSGKHAVQSASPSLQLLLSVHVHCCAAVAVVRREREVLVGRRSRRGSQRS